MSQLLRINKIRLFGKFCSALITMISMTGCGGSRDNAAVGTTNCETQKTFASQKQEGIPGSCKVGGETAVLAIFGRTGKFCFREIG
jgi:hypothetical protein